MEDIPYRRTTANEVDLHLLPVPVRLFSASLQGLPRTRQSSRSRIFIRYVNSFIFLLFAMAARLRLPTVAFAVLSICLSTAIIGTAGKAINFFMVNHKSNPWLLPIWPNHFENRELQGLVGISAAIVVLNAGLILSLFIRSVRSLSDQVWSTTNSLQLPANVIVLITSLLSAMCSLSGIIFQSVINQHAPARDTLQTWTCRWSNASINQGQGPPARFATICQETVR